MLAKRYNGAAGPKLPDDGETKQAQSLGACLQVIDRMQHLALQSTLLERAAVVSEGNTHYVCSWQDQFPRHPHDCGCPPDA